MTNLGTVGKCNEGIILVSEFLMASKALRCFFGLESYFKINEFNVPKVQYFPPLLTNNFYYESERSGEKKRKNLTCHNKMYIM